MSIKIEKIKTYSWESAIRGMRNALNSWSMSDSHWSWEYEDADTDGVVSRYFNDNFGSNSRIYFMRSGAFHSRYLLYARLTTNYFERNNIHFDCGNRKRRWLTCLFIVDF